MKELLELIAKALVDRPEAVEVREVDGEQTAVLENGTLAGSILTMDAAFRMLVRRIGLSLPDASRMCSATPAAALRQADIGAIAEGKWADLVVLDRDLRVSGTYIAGRPSGN